MPNIIEELKQSLKLLKLEWSEDLAQYKRKFLNTSLAEKKKEGLTWHPIQLKKTKIGMGERLIVEVERMDSNYPSTFSSGKSVTFFSTHEGYQGAENRVNGVVNQVFRDSMVVTLQADEIPDWMQDSRLGVDLLFDEASYREMEFALKKVIAGENPRLAELRDIALGQKSP
jgi:ATP-dependent RNA/DNA helicase IGHMBP2